MVNQKKELSFYYVPTMYILGWLYKFWYVT